MEKAMFGLIVMTVPLGIAVGLCAVAIARAGPDRPAGCAEEKASRRKIEEVQ
jgi:hypothetical protein